MSSCTRGILLSQDSKCYSEYFFSYLKACFPFLPVCLFMEIRSKTKISDLILQLHFTLQLILARKCCAYKLSRFCLCRFCLSSLCLISQNGENNSKNCNRNLWYCTLVCLNAKNRSAVLVRITLLAFSVDGKQIISFFTSRTNLNVFRFN